MPRELVTVQIGQCGNQLGTRFWDLALQEHNAASNGLYDDAHSSFFRNVDGRTGAELLVGSNVQRLRARAVCIDMEEGVLASTLRGPLAGLFEGNHFIQDVSGSGNNWAVGHCEYGPLHNEAIFEAIRRQVEHCESLQTFLVLHSLGGGTGSGLGTYVLNLLADEFGDAYRFACVVAPSPDDDVVTSPLNTVLSLSKLIQHADCVLPVDNAALAAIDSRISNAGPGVPVPRREGDGSGRDAGPLGAVAQGATADPSQRSAVRTAVAVRRPGAKKDDRAAKAGAYDGMNNVTASMLTSLTASVRFPGNLNVDINELTTNLVPFPRMHILVPSLSPLLSPRGMAMSTRGFKTDGAFDDVLTPPHHLLSCDLRPHKYLAVAMLLRGRPDVISVDDLNRNVARIKSKMNFVQWNPDGFKTGLCNVSPPRQAYSLLALANSTGVTDILSNIRERFMVLYRARAHFHHYERVDGFEEVCFTDAIADIDDVIHDYREVRGQEAADDCPFMFQPMF